MQPNNTSRDVLLALRERVLPTFEVERAGKFRIGDLVTVVQSEAKPWTFDWPRAEAIVWGVAIDRNGEINITIRHDGDVITDGFAPEDLTALDAALRSPGLNRDGERMRELLLDLRQDMSGAWFAPHEKAAYRASTTTFKKGNPYCDGWDDAFREAERCVDEAIRALPLAHEEKAGC